MFFGMLFFIIFLILFLFVVLIFSFLMFEVMVVLLMNVGVNCKKVSFWMGFVIVLMVILSVFSFGVWSDV